MGGKSKPGLSERQRQVLSLIDQRLTIKEIAGELRISETRVNQHIDTLKRRTRGEHSSGAGGPLSGAVATNPASPFLSPSGGKS